MEKISKGKALELLQTFTDSIKSVMLSTVDEHGEPFASYAPFVEDDEHNYYIGVSQLVDHTHNLATTGKVHLLFIEDESQAKGIFFRRRFYAKAKASLIKNPEEKATIIDLFTQRFGEEAAMIMSLPDFHLFKLSPYDANFVLGYGAAFNVSNDRQTLTQKTGKS